MSFKNSNPKFDAIIVAGGKGLRAGGSTPKQFRKWRGRPLIAHSHRALRAAGCGRIVIVIPAGMGDLAAAAIGADQDALIVEGGDTRQQSVRNGLEALADTACENILIHDAARPIIPGDVIIRLLDALADADGAIPVLPVVDSLVVAEQGWMQQRIERDPIRRVQTPQAFKFQKILCAHRIWVGDKEASDDAQVLASAGGKIALVDGDERLKKMTFAQDFTADIPPMRIGQGFDVHRLANDAELWLCGVKIDHDRGLMGHSDADVALHAITDALLGAIGAGDIGTFFPPSDPQWKGARSDRFVSHAMHLVGEAGYAVGNIDLTLICEEPKIGPYRLQMRARLAQILDVDEGCVSIKATTTEQLGFTGRGEGIAAQAIVNLYAD